MTSKDEAVGQLVGGGVASLFGIGWFSLFAFVVPTFWMWRATFTESCFLIIPALILTVIGVAPLLVGLGISIDGWRKLQVSMVPKDLYTPNLNQPVDHLDSLESAPSANDDTAEQSAATMVSVEPTMNTYQPFEPISVRFRNGPANPKDWIGLFAAGDPSDSDHLIEWLYVSGSRVSDVGRSRDTVVFSLGLDIGDYDVGFFENDNYSLLASSSFSVGPLEQIIEEETTTHDELQDDVEMVDEELNVESIAEFQVEELAQAVEELASDPELDTEVDALREYADGQLEQTLSRIKVSDSVRDKMRAKLTTRLDVLEVKLRDQIPAATETSGKVARGAAAVAAGAAAGAAITSAIKDKAESLEVQERADAVMQDGEVEASEVVEQVAEIVEQMAESEPESEAISESEEPIEVEEHISEPEPLEEPVVVEGLDPPEVPEVAELPSQIGAEDSDISDFVSMSKDVTDLLTSTERLKRVEGELERAWNLMITIDRISRTMGVGLGADYRDGRTVTGEIAGTGVDVSVMLPAVRNDEIDALSHGDKFSTVATIKEYRTVLRRFELLG